MIWRIERPGIEPVRAHVSELGADQIRSDRVIVNDGSIDIPDLLFLKNPDSKIVKNRLHLCLRPDDQAVEVARLESLGAKRIEIGQSETPGVTWIVMADPEGNEFCVLRARPAE